MCGIVSAVIFDQNKNPLRERILAYLFTGALLDNESRGKDATGVFLHYGDTSWSGIKTGLPASDFINLDHEEAKKLDLSFGRVDGNNAAMDIEKDKVYWNYWDFMYTHFFDSDVRAILAHSRKLTKGTAKENNNNHPILVPPILGVHNGKIENDDRIFEIHAEDFNRIGNVDSEAIFQMMNLLHPENGPGDKDYIEEVASSIQIGAFSKDGTAVVALHADHPGILYCLRKGDRPLEFCFSKELGVLFIISDSTFIKNQVDGLLLAQNCLLDTPNFNFEYAVAPNLTGYVINSNVDLNAIESIKDLLDPVTFPEAADEDYKKKTSVIVHSNTTSYENPVQNAYKDFNSKWACGFANQGLDNDKGIKELETKVKDSIKQNRVFSHTREPYFNEIGPSYKHTSVMENVTDDKHDDLDITVEVKETYFNPIQKMLIKAYGYKEITKLRDTWKTLGIDEKHFRFLTHQSVNMMEQGYKTIEEDCLLLLEVIKTMAENHMPTLSIDESLDDLDVSKIQREKVAKWLEVKEEIDQNEEDEGCYLYA